MIGKRGKILVILYMIFLGALFLMCSTDLIIREPEKEVYQMAVIIEDTRDDNYGNFRKGMDQAAVEFNADVRFITLYEKMDSQQQLELISREQQDGTDALLVVPADEEQIIMALARKEITIPVVLLGAELTGQEVIGSITVDYKEMGELLARKMAERIPKDCPVLVFAEPEIHSPKSRRFLSGAMEALESRGHGCQMIAGSTDQGFLEIMKAFKDWDGERAVILAESPEILTEAAGILADDPAIASAVEGLYGRGSNLSILNYVDRGLITGICVTDEFGMGYFGVLTAIEGLEGLGNGAGKTMDSWYIEKKDLRDPAYEKMLFPIE
ncbi:MAG: substrate-binding domain-containing protein [Hungatella sp.]|nr:substrate-binding domain-containing protein [Hungatella sp.]